MTAQLDKRGRKLFREPVDGYTTSATACRHCLHYTTGGGMICCHCGNTFNFGGAAASGLNKLHHGPYAPQVGPSEYK